MRPLIVLLFLVLGLPVYASAQDEPVKRTLVAFYDSNEESTLRFNLIHRFLEMPANHLGYNIQYYDINQGMPELGSDVYGVVLWFFGKMAVPDAPSYLDWLLNAVRSGKKVLIMESIGLSTQQMNRPEVSEKYQALMALLGIRDNMDWNPLTYEASIISQDKQIVGFEREYPPSLPAFGNTHIIPESAVSHLRVSPGKGEEPADLIVTNAHGGYIAPDYALYMLDDEKALSMSGKSEVVQWYVNPFVFLRQALDVPLRPIPDVTTLAGKRIFYSHVDGDGWNSISEIPAYAKNKIISAEVLRREILLPYSEFPFTVGLITADIDPECYGLEQSEKVARDIFALPNVEPSSHTHSHPLFWRFFADYSAAKEQPYLKKYPPRPKNSTSIITDLSSYFDKPLLSNATTEAEIKKIKLGRADQKEEEVLTHDYPTPRSYACSAFDLKQEIAGAMAIVNSLAPPGKKATLIQWSGDTIPFESVIATTRQEGYLNINGGDSRLDREYPSYAWVAPIGLQVGNERQIYSSNSNENTYTNLWTNRFFGFRYLQRTVANTENPIRVAPFNLYFHVYSAQKEASLRALKDNLEYARSLSIIPITASHYARIANGFYTTRITQTSPLSWVVSNRGEVQTIRFDNALQFAVNIKKSQGVIGYRHFQDSLYVALDPENQTPLITLKSLENGPFAQETPYLLESNWVIKALHIGKNSLTFEAAGYGNGSMLWQAYPDDSYRVTVSRGSELLFAGNVQADSKGVLNVNLGDVVALEPVRVTLTK